MDSSGTKSRDPQQQQCSEPEATQDWEKLKEEGEKFYRASQWSKAIDRYSKAIALNATSAVLYSNRARCHLELSDFARARKDAENAVRLDPRVVKYYWTLSRALEGLNLHKESAEACLAGLKLDHSDVVLFSRLIRVQQSGNGVFSLEKRPDGWVDIGLSGLKGRDKKMRQEVDNYYPRSDKPTGETQLNSSAMSSVLADLEVRAERGSVVARKYLRAHALLIEASCDAFHGEDVNCSFRLVREARKLWSDGPVLSRFLTKFNELAKEAFKRDPKNADALHVLILTEFLNVGKDLKKLIPMAKACVSLDPGVPEFHDVLGYLQARTGDYKNAVDCFDRTLELEWIPEVLFNKARVLVAMGNRKRGEGIKALEQYVETSEEDEPCMPFACYYAAFLNLTNGNEEKAERFWKKGQKLEGFAIDVGGSLKREMHEHKAFVQLYFEQKAGAGGVATAATSSGGNTVPDVDNGEFVTCAACGKPGKTLSVCGACRNMRYCGRECQRKHWPVHKKSCKKT